MAKNADKQRKVGIPFVKGVSGNPKGRPRKEVCVTSWLKEFADKCISSQIDPKKLTYAQAAALSAWKSAATGSLSDYNFIIERIEGKVSTTVDVTSKGNELKQAAVFNIINPDTKILLGRLENEGRPIINGDISQEPPKLSQPTDTPVT
jgi:hypothetical protein